MSARLPPDAAKAHAERLAEQLRANLRKRKAQARATDGTATAQAAAPLSPDEQQRLSDETA